MRDLAKLWLSAALVLGGWALLAGALDQADGHNARCSVVRCT
jgi:hypothetical protein